MTRLAAVAAAFLLTSSAFAHDLWIEPSTFHPRAGELVTASLRVGQKLHGEPLPRIPPLVDRFLLWRNGAEKPFVGRAGADPAGTTMVSDSGLQWIGYQSDPYPVTLEAQKFDDYLRDEGLERIVEARAKSGQSMTPGRERFYRCAKALLAADDKTSGTFDAPLGFTLELLPLKDPYTLKAGGSLPLSLLYRGQPIANILVVAMNRDDPEHPVRARTDAKGRVSLRLPRAGFWLIKAVHMQAAPAGAGVDWESWWASITFELPK
ncbi:MAG: hypothetical protein JWO97_900 [Acidobacteria bacterium]|nr:hypothetical protein [Acidobacteriota bacterium]